MPQIEPVISDDGNTLVWNGETYYRQLPMGIRIEDDKSIEISDEDNDRFVIGPVDGKPEVRYVRTNGNTSTYVTREQWRWLVNHQKGWAESDE